MSAPVRVGRRAFLRAETPGGPVAVGGVEGVDDRPGGRVLRLTGGATLAASRVEPFAPSAELRGPFALPASGLYDPRVVGVLLADGVPLPLIDPTVAPEPPAAVAVPVGPTGAKLLRFSADVGGTRPVALAVDAALVSRVDLLGAVVPIPGARVPLLGLTAVGGVPVLVIDSVALLGRGGARPNRERLVVLHAPAEGAVGVAFTAAGDTRVLALPVPHRPGTLRLPPALGPALDTADGALCLPDIGAVLRG